MEPPANADNLQAVTDSTDWLGTPLAALTQLEAAFRCHVCKDFLSAPVITSCNHTFCSLCIRRCLATPGDNKGKCPLCKKSESENGLRQNLALRESVEIFTKNRAEMLVYARRTVEVQGTIAREHQKRKATELEVVQDENSPRSPTLKRHRMSTRSGGFRVPECTASIQQEDDNVIDPDEDDAMYQPYDGLVSCPVCHSRMKPAAVNSHLDRCLNSPTLAEPPAQNPSRSKNSSICDPVQARDDVASVTTHLEKLVPLPYGTMKDAAIKKKLSELGLSTAGTRQEIEQRHREWVLRWNSNRDQAKPKSRSELMRELEAWERPTSGRIGIFSKEAATGASIRAKDFDRDGWATSHSASFHDLIAAARESRSRSTQKSKESGNMDTADNALSLQVSGGIDSHTLDQHTRKVDGTSVDQTSDDFAPIEERVASDSPGLSRLTYGPTVTDNTPARAGYATTTDPTMTFSM